MSFRDEEIAAEFESAAGMGREFFGDGYLGRLARVEPLEPKLVDALYWRKWRAEHPEQARAYTKKYRDSEKGKAATRRKKLRWRQKNRDKYNAQQRAAYARRTEGGSR